MNLPDLTKELLEDAKRLERLKVYDSLEFDFAEMQSVEEVMAHINVLRRKTIAE